MNKISNKEKKLILYQHTSWIFNWNFYIFLSWNIIKNSISFYWRFIARTKMSKCIIFQFYAKIGFYAKFFLYIFSKLIKDCEFMQIILDVKFSLNIECFHSKKVFVTCIMFCLAPWQVNSFRLWIHEHYWHKRFPEDAT